MGLINAPATLLHSKDRVVIVGWSDDATAGLKVICLVRFGDRAGMLIDAYLGNVTIEVAAGGLVS